MRDQEQFQQAREIFEAASDLDASQRQELVEERCGDDHELRAEVERLLAADADLHAALRTPVLGNAIALPTQTN